MSQPLSGGSRIVSEYHDDPDMIDLVQQFVEELPNRVQAMQKRLHESDRAALASLAHQLKGAAGGYGFPTITHAAGALEKSSRANAAAEQIAADLRQLADLCGRAAASPAD